MVKKYGCRNNRIYLKLKPAYEVVVVDHPGYEGYYLHARIKETDCQQHMF